MVDVKVIDTENVSVFISEVKELKMKRLTNAVLPVTIGYSLDDVESIRFIFVQGNKKKVFVYPSEKAERDEDTILLYWDRNDTEYFAPGRVEMDTLIKPVDSSYNPETQIVPIKWTRTLFERKDIEEDI